MIRGAASLAALPLLVASCGRGARPTLERAEEALERALSYLTERQEPDGAWRSASYAVLRDGRALTPMLLKTLLYAPPSPERIDALARAHDALLRAPLEGLAYPVYTAALSAIALRDAAGEQATAARARWIQLLRSHQLDEQLGWTPDDLAYGGFGYSMQPPHRPREGRRLPYDADLSSTLFALGALRTCGLSADDPIVSRARIFIERCQNHPGDGGFFFTPTNALQNKAGELEPFGTGRYRSYGAMTADGLRALLRCGLPPEHERVRAARNWLCAEFNAIRQPGDFVPAREMEREASYFYWCWSAAHALSLTGEEELDWATPLVEALLARQHEDGSFGNPFTGVMEDDPLVATPLACAALALAAQKLRAAR